MAYKIIHDEEKDRWIAVSYDPQHPAEADVLGTYSTKNAAQARIDLEK
jgi:hypothetical protein